MASFSYTGLKKGQKAIGAIDAEDKAKAIIKLKEQGVIVSKIEIQKSADLEEEPLPEPKFFMGMQLESNKVTQKDVLDFTNKLKTMISANLPIYDSLKLLRKQNKKPGMIKITKSLLEDLDQGLPFSHGLEKFPDTFNESYLNMVKAGEKSGTLGTFLTKINEMVQAQMKIVKEIKGAITYPVILLTVASLVTVVMLVKVVPVFQEIYASMGIELPDATQKIIAASEFMQGRGGALTVLSLILFFVGFKQCVKRFYFFRKRWHGIILKLPALGTLIEKSIYKGYINHEDKELSYSDHEIFDRYHKFNIKAGFSVKKRVSLNELNQLNIGDYVTHIDHGIGIFGGLQKIVVNGKKQEAVKLSYGERDTLYVSIHLIHKICKYSGKDGSKPKIFKLGSGAWKKIKLKAKNRVKQVAFNLIEAYAKRKLKKGFQYGPDSSIQYELEASFIYEDTPDQVKSTLDIKNDMESLQPMDRLICGDVGFGKTEIAIRAAFKAIDNGKQVAILVPTTILAFQHYKTFSTRLKEFPVTIDYLNRFRTSKEKTTIKSEIFSGKIDLIIGTHQLVNKSVEFKNLGLLIVDEEQKFGVSVKEKIRSIKENVDVLTLTATPIPRTLQYSLMSARDLSVINTPPQNRFPIDSNVISFKEEIIAEAINFEMQRGGQVFFVHNRIENIQAIAALILRLVPNADIAIVHGKIEGKKLEKTMLDFINGKFDVLISTTIIESGLDVPNANTIFINNAQNFGLSDLHQMRGRVGRSNKKAFCYFITSPYSSMTKEARKRIEAIEQHTELGSGFLIAMKDLEIRGAGDLLGAEQSGFINDIGFETYQKILKEAVEELKTKDFQNLFEEDLEIKNNIQIDTDLEILFPDDYINNIKERLRLYKLLSEINTDKELKEFENNLKDRFGEIPFQTVDLLKTVEIKWMGIELGFEKIILKNDKMICQFISDKEDSYYSSGNFQKILTSIHQNKNMCEVKEKKKNDKVVLLAIFKKIYSINEAIEKLKVF